MVMWLPLTLWWEEYDVITPGCGGSPGSPRPSLTSPYEDREEFLKSSDGVKVLITHVISIETVRLESFYYPVGMKVLFPH